MSLIGKFPISNDQEIIPERMGDKIWIVFVVTKPSTVLCLHLLDNVDNMYHS